MLGVDRFLLSFSIKYSFIGIFIFQYDFKNGRQKSRDYFFKLLIEYKFYILATFCESFTAIGSMVLEILCVEPIYP